MAFRRYAWGILAYSLLVVLWGAYVRASGSGAGCGGHWPLCNGELVPRSPTAATAIEFIHRITSGLSILGVAGLCLWAFRIFPPRHRIRLMAASSVLLLVFEALLGAGLVLFDYVAGNASAGRALYLSAHSVNTQLLLGALALTAWFAREPAHAIHDRRRPWPVLAAPAVALVLTSSGVIAALGDTVYPAASLQAGIRQELASGSQLLLRLRVLHPLIALAAGAFILIASLKVLKPGVAPTPKSAARFVMLFVFLQILLGIVNVALLAPVWMQIAHLLVADLLWLSLIIMVAESGSA